MGFWGWFWIWVGLIIASLGVFAIIGWSLFDRAMAIGHQLSKLAKPVAALIAAAEAKSPVSERESDVLADLGELEIDRRDILKSKSKKRAARQRSLITGLKNIDVNESRFTND
jgi:4-hydroxyphenylpyruvate dioxygenase-like putative hemolysin